MEIDFLKLLQDTQKNVSRFRQAANQNNQSSIAMEYGMFLFYWVDMHKQMGSKPMAWVLLPYEPPRLCIIEHYLIGALKAVGTTDTEYNLSIYEITGLALLDSSLIISLRGWHEI
jgi:hypothetical protein